MTVRGPYDQDEPRPPLADRGFHGAWTVFEGQLFNLVTQALDRQGARLLFSRRLAVTQAMLNALDEALAKERT